MRMMRISEQSPLNRSTFRAVFLVLSLSMSLSMIARDVFAIMVGPVNSRTTQKSMDERLNVKKPGSRWSADAHLVANEQTGENKRPKKQEPAAEHPKKEEPAAENPKKQEAAAQDAKPQYVPLQHAPAEEPKSVSPVGVAPETTQETLP